jgi:hypothetical protein
MKKEIKYIGFYNAANFNFQRVCSLAATNKMDYISDAITELGYKLHIVSPSWISGKGFELQKTVCLSQKKEVTLCPSVGSSNKIANYLSIILSLIWLFLWLLLKIKREEKILVYHSPWLVLPILWAKKIKGFKLILEVEEIYSDVSSLHPVFDNFEKKIFDNADEFLFSTDLLADKISNGRNYIVIYGNYNVPEKLASPLADGKIHIVYAGIIDHHKAGAFNAIESATFLTENHVIHVIGFGEIEKLQLRIKQINLTSKCKVFYDGLKTADNYTIFCQSCHVGLSTQKMDGKYLETSFPSKILSYLGMGLSVVSGKVDCVEKSKIGEDIFYYEIDHPKEIANAIKSIDFSITYNSAKIIEKLNKEFLEELKNILNDRK